MDPKMLCQLIKDANYTPRSYSGRYMHGRDCVGVALPDGVSAFTFGVELSLASVTSDGYEVIEDLCQLDVRTDHFGTGMIVYFPRVNWPAGEFDEIFKWMASLDGGWDDDTAFDESEGSLVGFFNPKGLEGPDELVLHKDGSWEASYESRTDEFVPGKGLKELQALYAPHKEQV